MQVRRAFSVGILCLLVLAAWGCKSARLRREGFEPIRSSVLDGVKYDAASRTLSIAFDSGDVYDYQNVPEDVYRGLIAAGSKGQYFQSKIKGRFSYTKR